MGALEDEVDCRLTAPLCLSIHFAPHVPIDVDDEGPGVEVGDGCQVFPYRAPGPGFQLLHMSGVAEGVSRLFVFSGDRTELGGILREGAQADDALEQAISIVGHRTDPIALAADDQSVAIVDKV